MAARGSEILQTCLKACGKYHDQDIPRIFFQYKENNFIKEDNDFKEDHFDKEEIKAYFIISSKKQ